MNCLENISGSASSTGNGVFPSGVNSCTLPRGDADEVEHTVSMAMSRPQLSISGVVDAILDVGNRRKALLGQLRSALLSSNDFEALGFARQLCGLPV